MKRYDQDSRFRGNDKEKSLVVIGPTSSGKSDLAVALAQQFSGEVISADSRQVFRGMDIGSGKITQDEQHGVLHHLLDVADPQNDYNISHFLADAKKIATEIHERNHLPIVCGGTGFWIQALVENQKLPEVPPNKSLRAELENQSTKELHKALEHKDPLRAQTIDRHNKIRLIRALEVVEKIGAVPALEPANYSLLAKKWCVLALCPEKEILHERIEKRLVKRMEAGMMDETRALHANGVPWERLESFGLEYKWTARFLQKEITQKEMRERLLADIRHYAKRQVTWLKRWEKQGMPVHWITQPDQAVPHAQHFLAADAAS